MADSLKITQLQSKIESLQKGHNSKVDSLEDLIHQAQINQSYFSDILSHQWILLSIQTAIFIAIILIIVTVASFISWKLFYKKLQVRIEKIEGYINDFQESNRRIQLLEENMRETSRNTLRSLYEGTENVRGKVIWHIRYCYHFYQFGDHQTLKIRLGKLQKEFNSLQKNYPGAFKKLLNFDNLQGLKDMLKDMVQVNDEEISSISIKILHELESSNTEN